MSKKYEIKVCGDCPYADIVGHYASGNCDLLNINIDDNIDVFSEIHKDCPLKEWNE